MWSRTFDDSSCTSGARRPGATRLRDSSWASRSPVASCAAFMHAITKSIKKSPDSGPSVSRCALDARPNNFIRTTDRRLAAAVVSYAETVLDRRRKWVGTKGSFLIMPLVAGVQVLLAVDDVIDDDVPVAVVRLIFVAIALLLPGRLARGAVRADRVSSRPAPCWTEPYRESMRPTAPISSWTSPGPCRRPPSRRPARRVQRRRRARPGLGGPGRLGGGRPAGGGHDLPMGVAAPNGAPGGPVRRCHGSRHIQVAGTS